MLYLLNIDFAKPEYVPKHDLYYAILGGFLSMFQKQSEVYESIVKLSFSLHKDFSIHITVQGEQNYNTIINQLLQQPQQQISINNHKFVLQQLRFDFKVLDPTTITFRPFSQFELRFASPAFVRQQNINYTLPQPEQFLFTTWSKCKKLFGRTMDDQDFKQRLKYNIYVGKFDLRTQLVRIKQGTKSGVVGNCKYYLQDKQENDHIRQLHFTLQALPFVGMGSGVKLGLGNVRCFIS